MINDTINTQTLLATDDLRLDGVERVVLGTCYLLVTTIYIILYSCCLYIMNNESEMQSSALYRIMIHLGYVDLLILFTNGIPAGVYTLLGSDKPFYLKKLLGGLLNSAWFTYYFLSPVLAVNRFIYIFAKDRFPFVFTFRWAHLLLAVGWIIGLVIFVAHCMPGIDLYYDVTINDFKYGGSFVSSVIEHVNYHVMMVNSVGLKICYFSIYFKVRFKVKNLTSLNQNQIKKDTMILLQAFFLCTSDTMAFITVYLTHLFPLNSKFLHIFTNCTCLICGGNSVFVYLLLNKTIRQRLKQLFCKILLNGSTVHVIQPASNVVPNTPL